MTDIKNTIEAEDVEWAMDWSGLKPDGTRRHPDRPETEMVFEEPMALAHLLINEVIHLNSHHWEDSWPKAARDSTHLGVDCSDVFAWACSDSEDAAYADIEPLYRMWAKDHRWGAAVWCMIKRGQMPQRPVEKRIRDAGIWDMDALKAEHGLLPNHYDGISGVWATHKYDAYCAWERAQGKDPLPFDKDWWEGWRRYVAEHPDWHDAAWKAEDDRLLDVWRVASGYASRNAQPTETPVDAKETALRLSNMLDTVAERRADAAKADTDGARNYLTGAANGTERALLKELPSLLRAVIQGPPS